MKLNIKDVQFILQEEVNKREKAKAKWKKFRSSDNSSLEETYERRYHMYETRFEGMCDMLYDIGLLAWTNDDNVVIVEKLVTYDEISF